MKAGSPGRSLLWINEYIHLCCSAASTSKCSCEIVSLKAHSSLLYETCLHFRGGIVLSLVAFFPTCVWIYICFFPLNVATYIILNNKSLSVHRNLRGTGQMCTRAFALEGLLTLFWEKKKKLTEDVCFLMEKEPLCWVSILDCAVMCMLVGACERRHPSPLTGPTWECSKHSKVGGKEEVTAESKIMC